MLITNSLIYILSIYWIDVSKKMIWRNWSSSDINELIRFQYTISKWGKSDQKGEKRLHYISKQQNPDFASTVCEFVNPRAGWLSSCTFDVVVFRRRETNWSRLSFSGYLVFVIAVLPFCVLLPSVCLGFDEIRIVSVVSARSIGVAPDKGLEGVHTKAGTGVLPAFALKPEKSLDRKATPCDGWAAEDGAALVGHSLMSMWKTWELDKSRESRQPFGSSRWPRWNSWISCACAGTLVIGGSAKMVLQLANKCSLRWPTLNFWVSFLSSTEQPYCCNTGNPISTWYFPPSIETNSNGVWRNPMSLVMLGCLKYSRFLRNNG